MRAPHCPPPTQQGICCSSICALQGRKRTLQPQHTPLRTLLKIIHPTCGLYLQPCGPDMLTATLEAAIIENEESSHQPTISLLANLAECTMDAIQHVAQVLHELQACGCHKVVTAGTEAAQDRATPTDATICLQGVGPA